MTTAQRPQPANIDGPDQLLAAVPYLLGFRPTQSLVLVGLSGRKLVVTARLDLDALEPTTTTLRDTAVAMVRGGATSVIGVVYTEQPTTSRPTDAHMADIINAAGTTTSEVIAELTRAGLQVQDVFLTDGVRWRSVLCSDQSCCPRSGRRLPTTATEFQAAATFAGVSVARTRDDVEARLRPADGRDALQPLIRSADQAQRAASVSGRSDTWERASVRAVFAAARSAASGRPGVSPDDAAAARLIYALSAIPVRDAVWLAVDDHRLPRTELWLELGRRAPTPYDAAPMFLLGWQAWRAGDGTTANIAVARALGSDPDYAAAHLLLAALERGINPRTLPRLKPRGRTNPNR